MVSRFTTLIKRWPSFSLVNYSLKLNVHKFHMPIIRYSSFSASENVCINLEKKYGANNYHPIPVVIERGKGVHLWDMNNKCYLDFLSAYSAVNQGHCHPKILETFHKQSNNLTLTSRAFHNNVLGEYCEYVCNFFNYKRLLPMNTGVEACESACKIARKWAYNIKGVPENKAIMVFAANNFWGRSFAAVSASTDPSAFTGYGPFMPGFEIVEYNNISQLESLFAEKHSQIAAFMCEPIQGEAGVIIPDDDYLTAVRALCTKYNILWIADEVQTGLGRCGLRLCIDWHFMKNNGPDIIALGKALSGGLMPISCVLTKTDEIMDVLTPGTHGSTYGGNPLACKVAMTALQVLDDENMCENSQAMGGILLEGLREIEVEFDMVSNTRGKGLFCAMEIETNEKMNANAWDICLGLKNNGLLAKPTHEHIIRLSPPLIINKLQIEESLEIIRTTLKQF